AFFTPDAGFVDDPQLAALNLADAARRNGATFLFHHEIIGIVSANGRVTGLDLADGQRVGTSAVINVGGPWSTAVNRLAGVGHAFTISVRPMRQEVHPLQAPPGFNAEHQPGPVVADLDLGIYVRGAPGDGMLIGGLEPECEPLQWVDKPEDANPNPT